VPAEKSGKPAGLTPSAEVLARLANDFFTALPGVVAVNGVQGAEDASPTGALPSDLSAGMIPMFQAFGSALPQELLQALQGSGHGPERISGDSSQASPFYFLDFARSAPATSPLTPGPASVSAVTSESAPIPGATPPGVPHVTDGTSDLPLQSPQGLLDSSSAAQAFYFLPKQESLISSAVPSALPVSEEFSLPGLPGFSEPPGAARWPRAFESGMNPPVDSTSRSKSSSPESADARPPDHAPQKPEGKQTPPSSPQPSINSLNLPEMDPFMLPGVPPLQSAPGNAGLINSNPTGEDLRALTNSVPGSSVVSSMVPSVVGALSLPYFARPAERNASTSAPNLEYNPFQLSSGMLPDMHLTPGFFDPRAVRKDFPILQERVNGRPLVWLDNGATTHKPNAVIDRISTYYRHENSNVHRAAHTLAARSTDAYEGAREKVRRFLNASSTREIVFVRGTTEGINLVAKSWGNRNINEGDEILITWLEHHANIVPWQQLCEVKGAKLRVAPVDDTGQVMLDQYEKLLNPRTRIVALSHVSNALGTITPAREMVKMAHRHGAKVLVDGAQSVAHMREDMQDLDCDFFVFSGHKMFAPTGIGVVYGKGDLFDNTPPWQGGGNMIADVTFEKTTFNDSPARFEAGTGNIADAVGLGAAVDYLTQVGIDAVTRYEHELLGYATAGILTVPGLRLIGTAKEKAGVLSFVLDGMRTEDVGKALDQEGIAVRAGHHCAQPILRRFGVESTVRATLALYNTCEDIDALVNALHRIQGASGRRGVTLQAS
jgi:cysteine desulfurase / selenocysteine lyase